MPSTVVPTINAALNATAAALLVTGYVAIRRHHRRLHRTCMLAALATSALFLTSYLAYHARVGSVHFAGPKRLRVAYLAILLTHSVLAALVAPAAVTVAWLALRRRFARHRAVARWTLPVWIYVSLTGVVVYWMLYRL
jgi:putative membrane protein